MEVVALEARITFQVTSGGRNGAQMVVRALSRLPSARNRISLKQVDPPPHSNQRIMNTIPVADLTRRGCL